MTKADDIKAELDVLEAERMILTVRLRNALLRAATDLLPEAIAQAKPKKTVSLRDGKKTEGQRPGSPALLRLISRLAMRVHPIERAKE